MMQYNVSMYSVYFYIVFDSHHGKMTQLPLMCYTKVQLCLYFNVAIQSEVNSRRYP